MFQVRNMTFQWTKKLFNLSMKKNILRKHNFSYTQNQKLGTLGKVVRASSFWRSCNLDAKTTKNLLRQKLKGEDMLLLEKVKSSEVSEFSILPYTQNGKVGNLGKCCFTSNFDRSCNLRCRNSKKLTETCS